MKLLFEGWKKFLKEQEGPEDFLESSYPLGEPDDTPPVAKVVIINEDGEVLILKRASHMDWNPGKWDLPGGHLKEGESEEEAAKREVKEETNLTVDDLKKIGEVNEITVFETRISGAGEDIGDDDENEGHAWIDPQGIQDYDFVPLLQDFVKQDDDKE